MAGFFSHSSDVGHQDCLHVLAIANCTFVNVDIHRSLLTGVLFPLGIPPEGESARLYKISSRKY